MKRLILLLFFLPTLGAYAQFTLQPMLPTGGVVRYAQLWNVAAVNSGGPLQCRLELILRERESSTEVLTASSNIFSLSKGANQLNLRSLMPIQYNSVTVVRSDNQSFLNAGSYTACYRLFSTESGKNTILADECITFDVEPLSPPYLVSPPDSAVLTAAPRQFNWLPPSPPQMFSNLRYQVTITEVMEGQTAAEAISLNPVVYTEYNTTGTVINYGPTYPALEKNKMYAWQVIAYDDRSYAVKTETWTFRVKEETAAEKIIKGSPFIRMRMSAPETGVAPDGVLKLSYNNRYADSTVSVTVKDMSGGAKERKPQVFSVSVRSGENNIEYQLSKIMQVSENRTYEASIENSQGEKWYVLFVVKRFKEQ